MSRKLGEIRRHRSRRWWTTGATLAAVAAFAVIFAAASSGTITGSTFEGNDGNMVVGGNPTPPGNGTKDWAAGVSVTSIPDGTGSTDDSIGSSKEDDPYPLIVTQSTPPKDDFTSVHLATEVISNNVYLYQSSIRSAPNGSANENVELNQSTTLSPNGVTPVRTVGDKLITFDFGGGTANITILNWNTSNSTPCADHNDSQPCWDTQTTLDSTQAEGAVNDGLNGRSGAISAANNTLTGAALVVNQFQEMAVNLTGTGILPTTASGNCETFASATIKSRSSGATGTFNSDLKDIVIAHKAITNCGKIIVKKHMVGGTGSFVFTGHPAGTISTQDGTIDETVPPNQQYVSTEATTAGWTLTGISCDSAHGTGDTGARTATFNPDPGEVITCTFTNTKPATITVKKVTDPTGDPATFGFTGDITATLGDGQSSDASVLPGTYHVTEAAKTGWDLSNISCDDANSSGVTATGVSTFTVAAGQHVTCTYTNTKRATITVKKVTSPAGDPATFGFTGDITATLGDGQSSDASVAPGTYHVTESAKTGWALTNISCDNGNSSGVTATGVATFVVTAGQHVTCTYTNTKRATITVKKLTDPSGDPATFSFTGDITATLGDGQSADASVAPGTYHVTEAAKTGWNLLSISCDNGNSSGVTATGVATFVVTAGQHVTCTYTNTKRATITVKKVTDPAGDPATFGFTGDITATLSDGQTSSASVAPGTYHVTEAAKTGWNLTNISCDDAGSSGVTATGVSTFVVTAGQHITCTYTNTKRATITVKKVTDPSGDPATFSFTGDITATLGDGQSADSSVAPGTYHVTESAKTGWDLTNISCDNGNSTGNKTTGVAEFVVTAGQHVTCTYTNTKRATITVKKVTDPAGDPATFSFTGDITATLGDGQSADQSVAPGTYHVTEAAKTGWNLTNISCDNGNSSGVKATGVSTFVVTAGQHVTCTYTNTKQASITVKKVTVPSGVDQTFSFTGDITASLSDGQSSGHAVSPGTYHVTEGSNAGWALTDITCDNANSSGVTATGVATFVVTAGQQVTCTYTNSRLPQVKVVKQLVPSNDPGTFDFAIGEQSFTNGGDGYGDGGNTGFVSVQPGTTTVSESGNGNTDLSNYDSSVSCTNDASNDSTSVDLTDLSYGDQVTCTFTNVRRATIEIVKHTLGAGGTFDFTLDAPAIEGSVPVPFQLSPASSGASDTADFSVSPGDFTVVEASKDGWALTGLSCSTGNTESSDSGSQDAQNANQANIHVTAGGFVQCTYTNTKLATLIVVKNVDNSNGGGSKGPGDFSIHVAAAGLELPGSPAAGSSSGTTYSGLMPGTYKVSEDAVSGYNLTSISGCLADGSVVLQAGATVTCTLTNTSNAPPPPPPPAPPAPKVDIQITKTGTPNPVTVGKQVTWTMVVTNNGPNGATNVTVADPVPAGTTFVSVATSTGTCANTGGVVNCQLGSLAVGASVTITLVTTAGQTGTLTNTATTVAAEQETNTANNTATASVVANGPFVPPVKYCTAVSVAPKKTLFVGRKTTLTLKVTQNGKAVKGIRIKIKGAKLAITTAPSNAKGMVKVTVKPTKAGIVSFAPVASTSCSNPRIGVTGVFTPPVTG